MEETFAGQTVTGKTQRFRSIAYPSHTIEHSEALSTRIFKTYGNARASRENMVADFKIGDSTLQTQLSSCVQYGLLDLKPGEGYKTTPLHTKLFKTLPSEKKEDALLEAFCNPDLYKNIIEVHNNTTLTQTGLSIILFRSGKIGDTAADVAAKVFVENANALGLIKNDYFSIDAGVSQETPNSLNDGKPPQTYAPNEEQTHQEPEVIYLPPPQKEKPKTFNHPPIPIFFDDGSVAEVYLPNGFIKKDVEKIIKVLQAQIA